MQRIEGVIFDFDGTLAELHIDFSRMKKGLLALAGAFLETVPPMDSLPALEWLDHTAAMLGKDNPAAGKEFHTRGRLLITALEMDAADKGCLFPATLPVLDRLAAKDIPAAIITRNCTAAVKRVCPEIETHCRVFLARDGVSRVKPDPVHVNSALVLLKRRAGQVLVVGDHPMDVETARRVGCLSAAVTSGRITREELASHHPDFLAADCGELIELLERKAIL